MNVALWVSPVGEPGGVGRHLLDVARENVPGWELAFLVPEGVLAQELREAGARVFTGAFGPKAGLFASIATFRKAVRISGATLVHTHLSYADVIAAIASTGLRITLVSTEHGIAANDRVYHGNKFKARIKAIMHWLRLKRFDRLIAVSQATRAAMIEKWRPTKPITVIYNGIDQGERPIRRPGLRVVSIARLAHEKRIDVSIRAFAALREHHVDATLTIAGDGDLDEQLRAKSEGIDGVTFVGHQPIDQLVATHDVLIQLSVWENCSYSMLDAMAAGMGVVATPVGGNPEIVTDASLIDADDVAAIAETLVEQGRNIDARPNRPDWPTVATMTREISLVYASTSKNAPTDVKTTGHNLN